MSNAVAIAVAVLFATVAVPAQDNDALATAKHVGWVETTWVAALDRWMPNNTDRRIEDTKTAWEVVAQRIPSLGGREQTFYLTKDRNGTVRVSVVMPVRDSIFQQLHKLKTNNPALDEGVAIDLLSVKQSKFDDRTCPELSRLARNVEEISVPVLPSTGVGFHGTAYSFSMRTLNGSTRWTIDVGPTNLGSATGLLKWFGDADDVLSRCMDNSAK